MTRRTAAAALRLHVTDRDKVARDDANGAARAAPATRGILRTAARGARQAVAQNLTAIVQRVRFDVERTATGAAAAADRTCDENTIALMFSDKKYTNFQTCVCYRGHSFK